MSPYIYILTTNGLLLILSVVFLKFPPKKINNLYGYRTHRSMLNKDIWDFSNLIFSKELLKYAIISFLAGLLFAAFFNDKTSWQPMVLVLLAILVAIIKTERTISDNFTEEGKRKK